MTGTQFGLAASVFLACSVEGVEALTIVLAVGTTRSWRSALTGVGAALVALAALTAALGPALTALPLDALRLVVGGLLLIFGLQWLRKAILRASGLKAIHDEDAIYEREQASAEAAGLAAGGGIDPYAFTISFTGVLLEGLEVIFIVLTFWGAEGAGARWPAGDGALLVIVPCVLAFAISMVLVLRRRVSPRQKQAVHA